MDGNLIYDEQRKSIIGEPDEDSRVLLMEILVHISPPSSTLEKFWERPRHGVSLSSRVATREKAQEIYKENLESRDNQSRPRYSPLSRQKSQEIRVS